MHVSNGGNNGEPKTVVFTAAFTRGLNPEKAVK